MPAEPFRGRPGAVALGPWSRIPSVNPMGRALSGPEFFESRLTAYLEEWLGALGVRLERQPVAPGRDNLLAWYDQPGAPPHPFRRPSGHGAGRGA